MFYFERRRFVDLIKMVDEKLIGTNVARCSPAPSEKPFKLVLVPLGERDTGTSPGMSSGGPRTPTTRPAGRKQSPFDTHDWPHCMSGSFLFHKLLLRRAQHFLSLCWSIHLVARLLVDHSIRPASFGVEGSKSKKDPNKPLILLTDSRLHLVDGDTDR